MRHGAEGQVKNLYTQTHSLLFYKTKCTSKHYQGQLLYYIWALLTHSVPPFSSPLFWIENGSYFFTLFHPVDVWLSRAVAGEAAVVLILCTFGKDIGRWSNIEINFVFGSWKILINVPLHLKKLNSAGLLQSKAKLQREEYGLSTSWIHLLAEPFQYKPHCQKAVSRSLY